MTVEEMIRQLSECPMDATVRIPVQELDKGQYLETEMEVVEGIVNLGDGYVDIMA